ncbi:MAG TPA: type VI secretion system protein TssA [Gemmatirosa sp.]
MPALDPDTLAAILAPIPGESPAGQDLRYDPRYDVVRDARREDDELPAGGLATERKVADWPRVQADAITLLSTGAKDLTIASWLTEALLKRGGIGGLTSGLTVVHGLVDQYWETLYPALEDGDEELRLGPLDWIGSRLAIPLRRTAVATDGLTFLAYRDSLAVPSEAEAEENRDKRALRVEKLAEGKLAPEVATAAVAATPKAFYKALVADLTAATRALDALETATAARFEDEPPNFRALRAALDEMQRFATATLAEKLLIDPDPVEEADVAEGGSDAGASSGVGGPLAAEPVDRNDAAARVTVAARFLRQQDPTAPTPYLLLRGLRWGEVRSSTGPLDPKLLDAPPPAARTRLKALLLDGKWPELLEQGEQIMATPAGRGWLDLQRYVITACRRLGPGYHAVELAIRAELAALLAAVPQLPEMTLMDDMPTANGETLDWLADEALDGEPVAASNGAGPDDGTDSELPDGTAAFATALDGEGEGDLLTFRGTAARHGAPGRRRTDRHTASGRNGTGDGGEDPFLLARSELARGRTNRAVELLVAELDRERSARGRFVRQTQLAQVMVEAGLAQVAQPILRQLVETIDEKSLESWEAGPLVAQPMVLMCRVIDALEIDTTEREELYLRVCRLDPLQAIGLRRAG